ncbi:hypothetical protein RV15_GL002141 [Enterococcus silesiacus]|uniref:Tyr recombinase domain-containing protein n=2 Tax=Enterococcus silesiacus TaxID=332949 RepID=A0AA91GD60_9ENTE|nr:site-specific integrase [Enterococcus silesiacus]OJG93007.1 hypothetical protein RV15_GL002141 [Enterococcus silesiacus]
MIKQYEKKNGEKLWYFKAYLGIDPLTGKKKYTTRRGFKTKKEAKTAMSMLELSVKENGFSSSQKAPTFKEVSDIWFAHYKKSVTESTLSRTRILFDKHILPKFGSIKIDKIDTMNCQKIINEWHEKSTYKNYPLFMNYIDKVFKLSINMGITNQNPTTNVLIPVRKNSNTEKKLKFYTKDQLQNFLATIENEQNPYFKIRDYTLFRLLAFSGCRIGEILALTWSDLDFNTNTLSIHRTVTKGQDYYISETPKTKKSNRQIVLDQKTIKQLNKWKLSQKQFLFKFGFSQPAFIFTTEKNNFTINQAVTERYKVYQNRAKLPDIGLHGFRHTHASMLYNAKATDKEVAERLGHSNIKTTLNIYTHLSDDQKEGTTEKLIKYIEF